MPLIIPEDERPKIRALATLPEDKFKSLISAVSEMKPTLTASRFESELSKRLPGFEDLFSVLSTVLALYWLKEKWEYSAAELAIEISQSAVNSSGKIVAPDMQVTLRDRLTKLLDFDSSLGVTAKAHDVMTETQRVFCNARILSDIRPVFASGPTSASGAMIIHNLQIGYHSDGKHQEVYVSLDTEDIEQLKQIITRAEEKTQALKLMIEKSGVPYLEA